MHDPELARLRYSQGAVVYFRHVHTSKVKKVVAPDRRGNVEVECKDRRVLVLSKTWWCDLSSIDPSEVGSPGTNNCISVRLRAEPGYCVVALQSEVPPGRESWFSKPYPGLIEPQMSTAIHYAPVIYPASCCVDTRQRRPQRLKDQNLVNQTIKEITLRGLGLREGLDPQVL